MASSAQLSSSRLGSAKWEIFRFSHMIQRILEILDGVDGWMDGVKARRVSKPTVISWNQVELSTRLGLILEETKELANFVAGLSVE